MARVSNDFVKSLIDTGLTEDQVTPFLLTASIVVTENMITLPDGTSTGYSEDRLAMIEAWLAAHYISVRDSRVREETTGAIGGGATSATYDVLRYFDQAKMLDPLGILSAIAKTKGSAEVWTIA